MPTVVRAMSRQEYSSSREARASICSKAPMIAWLTSSSGNGGSSGDLRSLAELRDVVAEDGLVGLEQVPPRLFVVLRGLQRHGNMSGANALMPSSAYMYQTMRSGASRASSKRVAHEPVHVLHRDLVAGDEQVALGGEVRVEHLRGDAEFRDEVRDPVPR